MHKYVEKKNSFPFLLASYSSYKILLYIGKWAKMMTCFHYFGAKSGPKNFRPPPHTPHVYLSWSTSPMRICVVYGNKTSKCIRTSRKNIRFRFCWPVTAPTKFCFTLENEPKWWPVFTILVPNLDLKILDHPPSHPMSIYCGRPHLGAYVWFIEIKRPNA